MKALMKTSGDLFFWCFIPKKLTNMNRGGINYSFLSLSLYCDKIVFATRLTFL